MLNFDIEKKWGIFFQQFQLDDCFEKYSRNSNTLPDHTKLKPPRHPDN